MKSLPPLIIKLEQLALETNLIALLSSMSILSVPMLNDLEYHSNQFGFSGLTTDTFFNHFRFIHTVWNIPMNSFLWG